MVDEDYMKYIRDQAAKKAMEGFAEKQQEQQSQKALKKQNDGLDSLREEVKSLKRGKVVQCFVCDNCQTVVTKPEDGFVIQGNIYDASPTNPGGLVGNNIPPPESETNVVKKTILCKPCLIKTLGLYPVQVVKMGVDPAQYSWQSNSKPLTPHQTSVTARRQYP